MTIYIYIYTCTNILYSETELVCISQYGDLDQIDSCPALLFWLCPEWDKTPTTSSQSFLPQISLPSQIQPFIGNLISLHIHFLDQQQFWKIEWSCHNRSQRCRMLDWLKWCKFFTFTVGSRNVCGGLLNGHDVVNFKRRKDIWKK